jgi:hypothetical protein
MYADAASEVVRPIVLCTEEQSRDAHTAEIIQCYNDLADAVIEGIFRIQLNAQMVSGGVVVQCCDCAAEVAVDLTASPFPILVLCVVLQLPQVTYSKAQQSVILR